MRYTAPGEWGKILGLDRSLEVKTLRKKIKIIAAGKSKEWGADLCQMWMANSPTDAGTLYVDGHVRVYHGKEAKLPKHYVSREKLCAHASADY